MSNSDYIQYFSYYHYNVEYNQFCKDLGYNVKFSDDKWDRFYKNPLNWYMSLDTENRQKFIKVLEQKYKK